MFIENNNNNNNDGSIASSEMSNESEDPAKNKDLG